MTEHRNGDREIRAALAESRRLLVACGLFSMAVNVLMLTGPLFMLQIYDRVLGSRSEATLVTLAALVAFLFLLMGVLDHARGRVLARVGARLQERLDPRVLRAILVRSVAPAERSRPATGLADLEAIQRFASSSGALHLLRCPLGRRYSCSCCSSFTGCSACWRCSPDACCSWSRCSIRPAPVGSSRKPARQPRKPRIFSSRRGPAARPCRGSACWVRCCPVRERCATGVLDRTLAVSDRNGLFGVVTKTLRLFLQSMMLGLGAWLALRGEVSPGIMIAGSILLGRALAPIDQAVGYWPRLQRAVVGWRALGQLLSETPPEAARTALPAPRARLEAHSLTVAPPGSRYAVCGRRRCAWVPARRRESPASPPPASRRWRVRSPECGGRWAASVRLDGAELDHYGSAELGLHIGYLPQEVVLFEGTVAENIARMAPTPDDAAVVAAANGPERTR